MDIIRNPADEVKSKAAASLNELFQKYSTLPILFLSSGGSALDLLNQIDEGLLSPKITVSVLDERFYSDPIINNFLQLKNTQFYNDAKNSGCLFLETVPDEDSTLESFSGWFESVLKDWKVDNTQGKVIITQGIGMDGHTSGIMSHPDDSALFERLFEGEGWVTGYDAGGKNTYPLRVTTTVTFLKEMVDHSICLVLDRAKEETLNKLLEKKYSLAQLPAGVLWRMKDVKLFTDILSVNSR